MASIQVQTMRDKLLKRYPGKKWKDKVLKMSDGQVIAVYMRMAKNGEIQ